MALWKQQSKIYVSGHTGLLGSAVVRRLKHRGFSNLILKTHSELDLLDQQSTSRFFQSEKPEFVMMCAARVGGIKANIHNQGKFLYENLMIQNNVIEAARQTGVRKLLFVASTCIYPRNASQPLKEESLFTGPLEPTNEGYAVAKLSGLKLCEYYKNQYGCDFISAAPTNLFGINDHYDLDNCHLLPALIRKIHEAKIRQEQKITLWGTGKVRREFMLSDDCADALLFIMENYSEKTPINVGTSTDASVEELAHTVARVLNASIQINFDTSMPDGIPRKWVDTTKLHNLGWKSSVPLEEAIQIAYDAFLKTPYALKA